MRPKLIHPLQIVIVTLDKIKSEIDKDINLVKTKVYNDQDLIIIDAQQKFEYNKINRIEPFLNTFVADSTGYFIVYSDDIYDEDGKRLVNEGDYIKDLKDNEKVIPLELFIRAIKPTAAYEKIWMQKLFVEDRFTELPRNEAGEKIRSSVRVQEQGESESGSSKKKYY